MRKMSVVLVLAVTATLMIAAVQASTMLNLNWNTSGIINADIDTGDASMTFTTNAAATNGSLYAEDYDDNPYGYGVDSFKSNFSADFASGFTTFNVTRLTSKESMYGPADQSIEVGLMSSGTGSVAWQTTTNYADLRACNYGFQANDQLVADGVYDGYVQAANGDNWAYSYATGDGTLDQDLMSVDMGSTSINFGAGCGCYTNADVTATGSGMFEVAGSFGQGLTTSDVTVTGPATYTETYTFGDGFTWDGYNFMGN